jgi:hypothetical protein
MSAFGQGKFARVLLVWFWQTKGGPKLVKGNELSTGKLVDGEIKETSQRKLVRLYAA